MQKFIIKIEKIEHDKPFLREVCISDLPLRILSDCEKIGDRTETFQQKEYRLQKVKLHLGDLVGLYVDDKSYKIIEHLMAISNEQIKLICENRINVVEEGLKKELFEKDQQMKEKFDEAREKIKKLPWYNRLLNNF